MPSHRNHYEDAPDQDDRALLEAAPGTNGSGSSAAPAQSIPWNVPDWVAHTMLATRRLQSTHVHWGRRRLRRSPLPS